MPNPGKEIPGKDDQPPDTEQSDAQEIVDRSAIGPHIVHGAIRREGEEELGRPPTALAWSGLAAGLSMGFSLITQGLLQSHLPEGVWRPLIVRAGYCVGFLIIVLGRQQLFTENTLTVILPLLEHKDSRTLALVARLWTVVLVTNVVGTLAFAWIVHSTAIFDADMMAALTSIAREALPSAFWPTFVRGVFAGWLIALMVWLLPAAESARVSIIVIVTYVVALGGFSHIVAGSVDVFYAILAGAAPWSTYFALFLPATLLGNIVGGVALVAALNHAQVKSGSPE